MGGKSASAPDYTELAAASREAVALGRELGNRQIDFSERQYDELKPLFESIAALQMEAQQEQITQGRDYFDYMKETFRPVERGIVEDAMAFSTESYRERMAGEAAAAAGRAFTNLQRSASRADAARGLNPNSPAARALRQQANVEMAASRSQQMTGARDRAEQLGYARQLDAAGLGRGLPGASAGAYAGSVGAGSAAVGTSMAAGNQYMAGLGAGAGTMMSGYQTGIQGFGNIVNSQTSVYGSQLEKQGAIIGGLMGLGSAGIGAMSDRRLKEDIKFLHEDMNSGLNVYEFSYVGEPNRRFIGVMADEVEEVFPEAVHYGEDGYASVDYAAIGMRMIEVSEEVA
ncbi:MAG: tail fiber domain-containing protein [Rhodospirillales bacterium]